MSRLLAAMESNDEFELEKIKKIAKEDKTMANGEWISEKIEEIKKGTG
jgi:hypothetical protein